MAGRERGICLVRLQRKDFFNGSDEQWCTVFDDVLKAVQVFSKLYKL